MEDKMHYSKKHKEAILKKMMSPSNKIIPQISREEGIPVSTLYTWRTKARESGEHQAEVWLNPVRSDSVDTEDLVENAA